MISFDIVVSREDSMRNCVKNVTKINTNAQKNSRYDCKQTLFFILGYIKLSNIKSCFFTNMSMIAKCDIILYKCYYIWYIILYYIIFYIYLFFIYIFFYFGNETSSKQVQQSIATVVLLSNTQWWFVTEWISCFESLNKWFVTHSRVICRHLTNRWF